jgi:hypothetical protein
MQLRDPTTAHTKSHDVAAPTICPGSLFEFAASVRLSLERNICDGR